MKNRPSSNHHCQRRKAHLRKGKEAAHLRSFFRSITNKKRRLAKQVRKHPNDKQAAERLKCL